MKILSFQSFIALLLVFATASASRVKVTHGKRDTKFYYCRHNWFATKSINAVSFEPIDNSDIDTLKFSARLTSLPRTIKLPFRICWKVKFLDKDVYVPKGKYMIQFHSSKKPLLKKPEMVNLKNSIGIESLVLYNDLKKKKQEQRKWKVYREQREIAAKVEKAEKSMSDAIEHQNVFQVNGESYHNLKSLLHKKFDLVEAVRQSDNKKVFLKIVSRLSIIVDDFYTEVKESLEKMNKLIDSDDEHQILVIKHVEGEIMTDEKFKEYQFNDYFKLKKSLKTAVVEAREKGATKFSSSFTNLIIDDQGKFHLLSFYKHTSGQELLQEFDRLWWVYHKLKPGDILPINNRQYEVQSVIDGIPFKALDENGDVVLITHHQERSASVSLQFGTRKITEDIDQLEKHVSVLKQLNRLIDVDRDSGFTVEPDLPGVSLETSLKTTNDLDSMKKLWYKAVDYLHSKGISCHIYGPYQFRYNVKENLIFMDRLDICVNMHDFASDEEIKKKIQGEESRVRQKIDMESSPSTWQ